jgi:RNA polymerase sigma-70 factor (ECF subfamily)
MGTLRMRAADGPEEIVADESTAADPRDAVAFTTAYLDHREAVYRFLRGRSRGDDEALELTAVTFERAWSALPNYEPSNDGMRPWLLRIARNAAIDEARRLRHWVPGWLTQPAETAPRDEEPERIALRADENRYLRALLAQLPGPQRDAIALRFGAGLTAREIGEVIGRSEEASQKLVVRGLARLKEIYRA